MVRVAPDPDGIRRVAEALARSRNPVLVLGAAVDRSQGWEAVVALAEKLPGLDTIKLAEGFGCQARRVTEPGDVSAALQEALRSRHPTLLEVALTPEIPWL